jgi:hypothetical protein
MKRFWQWFKRRPKLVSTAALEAENAELRELVREMYEWTHHKHTRWARRAAKVLRITNHPWDEPTLQPQEDMP